MSNEWWTSVRPVADPSELPKLHTEVWEQILDELDVSYGGYNEYVRRRIFAACCLVCRAWSLRSRYHLFKFVEVRSKKQVKEVSKVLRSIPALRTRVEKLTVDGSGNERKDASWIGLVGFHLGPKLKALEEICVQGVNLSLMGLEDSQFWGAFNRSWRPGAMKKLQLLSCRVTHANQLIRLAFLTKAEELFATWLLRDVKAKSAPAFSSGISLPLRRLYFHSLSPDLVFPIPWHTLGNQCPSLSSVDIVCPGKLDLASPDGRLFLVSILHMFHCMQRHNDTTDVTLGVHSLPTIEMGTRRHGQSASADDNPPTARPRLHRKLVLRVPRERWGRPVPVGAFATALTLLEEAMALTNYTNRRLHHVEIDSHLRLKNLPRDSFQPIDGVLSRLRIATHDVHVVIKGRKQPYEGCVLTWAREHFPMLTEVIPKAFCDPEDGQPCDSHSEQVSGNGQGQRTEDIDEETDEETDVGTDDETVWEGEGTAKKTMEEEQDGLRIEAGLVEQNLDADMNRGGEETESEQPERVQATANTEKREVVEGSEGEGEEIQGKTEKTE